MSTPNTKKWLILLPFLLIQLAYSLSRSKSELTESQINAIRTSPFGISAGPSLVLRSKHVQSVHFFKASRASAFGFTSELGGLLPQSLAIKAESAGHSQWGVQLNFKEPFDAHKYNSFAFWMRTSNPHQKFWFSFRDKSHHQKAYTSGFGRPEAFRKGLTQVVVPFSWITGTKPLDFSSIDRIGIYFGASPVGSEVFIDGISFIEQPSPLSNAYIFTVGAKPRPFIKEIVKKDEKKTSLVTAELDSPEKNEELVELPVASTASTNAVISSSSAPVNVLAKKPMKPFQLSPRQARAEQASLIAIFLASFRSLDAILAGVIGVLCAVWWFVRHREIPLLEAKSGKVFLQVTWPFEGETAGSHLEEKKFWKDKKDIAAVSAWISPFQVPFEKISADEFYGESFLLHHIKQARETGLSLIPSLCFVRTLFRFENFISNPKLFLTKTLTSSEHVLSDEELRSRYIGYFPLWIPPYWQKNSRLPQRILVAYGRMPGYPTTHDSVQFNLWTPEFREMVMKTLERFAEVTTGVRIEGAAALLSSHMMQYWNGHLGHFPPVPSMEFWKEVITSVRVKHPQFQFYADAAGPDAQKLLELGFDFVENNFLVNALMGQVRQEQVGALVANLEESQAGLVQKSIYNLSPLFNRAHTNSLSREQNLLASAVLSMLPGLIQHDDQVPSEFSRALHFINTRSLFKEGGFALLSNVTDNVLSFARWQGKTLLVAVANFSIKKKDCVVDFHPLVRGFSPGKLYLFNDLFHGTDLFKIHNRPSSHGPAVAVLGRDLLDSGLPVSLSELSLRLFSVSLSRPIPNEIPTNIRELHKA